MTRKRKLSGDSPLRRKMIQVMTLKGHSESTQQCYQQVIGSIAVHYQRPPELLSGKEICDWVIGRIEQGRRPRTTNVDVAALRLFYIDVLDQPDKVEGLHRRRQQDRLPRAIPEADVQRLILGIRDPRYRTATLTAYGAGLRISEVVALQVSDVLSQQGLLRIRSGKGGHERVAHLPALVLDVLRRYYKSTQPRPVNWLFCHRSGPEQPISTDSLRAAFNRSRDQAGLDRSVTFHTLRHSCATHLHERGAALSVVQDVLGHKSLESTRVYARTTGVIFRQLDHPVAGFAGVI